MSKAAANGSRTGAGPMLVVSELAKSTGLDEPLGRREAGVDPAASGARGADARGPFQVGCENRRGTDTSAPIITVAISVLLLIAKSSEHIVEQIIATDNPMEARQFYELTAETLDSHGNANPFFMQIASWSCKRTAATAPGPSSGRRDRRVMLSTSG
jgi:hypothetical protein